MPISVRCLNRIGRNTLIFDLADLANTFFVPDSRNTPKFIKLVTTMINAGLFYNCLLARESQLLFLNGMMEFPIGSLELKQYLNGRDSHHRSRRKVGIVRAVTCTHSDSIGTP